MDTTIKMSLKQYIYFTHFCYSVVVLQVLIQEVFVQVDKDIRHPLLLEQPSLQAAISSWRSDFELQEIFRKGKAQLSPGSL